MIYCGHHIYLYCRHSSRIGDTLPVFRTPFLHCGHPSIPLLRTLALYFENFDLLRTPFFHPRHHSYLYRRGSYENILPLYVTDTETHFGDTVPCYVCSHFQSIAGPLHILVNNIIAIQILCLQPSSLPIYHLCKAPQQTPHHMDQLLFIF